MKDYNRIKAVLADKKVSNNTLANALGVSAQTVSRWCTNNQQPSIETLFAIAKYLKVDARELLQQWHP